MAFRADESIRNGFELIKSYLIPRDIDKDERIRSEDKLQEIVDKYGPVIDSYPSWHPLVTNHDSRIPVTSPSKECGYHGLDHTKFLVNAFITCPYGDGQDIIDSVEALPFSSIATITAERLDVKLYNSSTTSILIRCDWNDSLGRDGMIPASQAIPLMLQKEVPCYEWAIYGETWETMRPYFIGSPHGSRSSLFVNQETALTMKKIWTLLINTGMYGPLKISNQY